MKSLTLLRHAQADSGRSQSKDLQRDLSIQGKKDMARMTISMREANVRPSLILSSSAVRTWETAKIVAADLGYPNEFLQREASLYLANTSELLRVIAGQDDGFNHLMIVGHNPGLSDLADLLVPGAIPSLPAGGWISIELDTKSWGLVDTCTRKLLSFGYPSQDSDD